MEILGGLLVLATLVLLSGLRVVREYERLVVFRCGRLRHEAKAGLRFVWPFLELDRRVDTRVVTLPIPAQDAITRDNIAVEVAAVCFFQISDCSKAVAVVADPVDAAGQLAQSALRNIIGSYDFDSILNDRDKINARLQATVDEVTSDWGIRMNSVELKDLEIPASMRRALAAQAEGERLRRARVIACQGELEAAPRLAEAATELSREPDALVLRQLQTMADISKESRSTLVLPFPVEIFEPAGDES